MITKNILFLLKVLLFEGTFTSVFEEKVMLMIETGSVQLMTGPDPRGLNLTDPDPQH